MAVACPWSARLVGHTVVGCGAGGVRVRGSGPLVHSQIGLGRRSWRVTQALRNDAEKERPTSRGVCAGGVWYTASRPHSTRLSHRTQRRLPVCACHTQARQTRQAKNSTGTALHMPWRRSVVWSTSSPPALPRKPLRRSSYPEPGSSTPVAPAPAALLFPRYLNRRGNGGAHRDVLLRFSACGLWRARYRLIRRRRLLHRVPRGDQSHHGRERLLRA